MAKKVATYITEPQKRALEALAEEEGMSVSTFLRRLILRRLDQQSVAETITESSPLPPQA